MSVDTEQPSLDPGCSGIARTATAPNLIGLVFIVLGIGFGESGYALLKTIPDVVSGWLLVLGDRACTVVEGPQHQGGDLSSFC